MCRRVPSKLRWMLHILPVCPTVILLWMILSLQEAVSTQEATNRNIKAIIQKGLFNNSGQKNSDPQNFPYAAGQTETQNLTSAASPGCTLPSVVEWPFFHNMVVNTA